MLITKTLGVPLRFAAALLLSVGVGCHCAPDAAAAEGHHKKRTVWMVSVTNLHELKQAGFSEEELKRTFDNPNTFLMRSKADGDEYLDWRCTPTRVFPSYKDLQWALRNARIDRSTKAIVYDNEGWQMTPKWEQHDPALYEKKAAALAHRNGLLFISVPATSLVKVLDPSAHIGNIFENYLKLGIAGDAASHADIFEIQAQGSQADTAKFADFIRQAAAQARRSNPNVIVLAGLSTGPSGKLATADEIYQAANSVADCVDGYWLNIPKKNPGCPNCTPKPRADLAIEFLRKFDRKTGEQ